MAKGCSERSADSLAYVSTAFVARDVDALREALGEEKLVYWGFSYGTGIGATYTGIFPQNVGRVVLDACEYPVDGRSALMWGKTSLDNVVDVFEAFLETCASVGPARCPLVKVEGTTAVDLRLSVEGLLMSLSHRPIPVPEGEHKGIVTRWHVLSFLYQSLYRPNVIWPRLAEVLDALIVDRNRTLLLQELAWTGGLAPHTEEGIAVICSDAVPANSISLEEWESQTRQMTAKSFISGEIRSLHTLPCRTWLGRPKERYVGNFSQTLANTVLLIGGTHDPATPLRNARRLAADMGDSARLIVHHGYGHSSTRHVSNCTTQAVRDLFLHGKVPDAAETHCLPSEELFPVAGQEFGLMHAEEERSILLAMRGIGESLPGGW
ncbi:alpha/beta-hydrolase [Calocera cornea HHB12733]|uniref:Alpha/beta-hydrolase n=1 Tax=Calocera cornea HHB12733 TaxID=1353952 RepID=A0A165CKJ6_9BASI|nr:alpha/beta-hydrolase [Calocera cornea HHB12733]